MSDSIEPYIGQKGYSIPKECMEVDDQDKIKKRFDGASICS